MYANNKKRKKERKKQPSQCSLRGRCDKMIMWERRDVNEEPKGSIAGNREGVEFCSRLKEKEKCHQEIKIQSTIRAIRKASDDAHGLERGMLGHEDPQMIM